MSELLPCPFCGGNSDLDVLGAAQGAPRIYWVKCNQCRVSTPGQSTAIEAVAAWNRRTAAPQPPAPVDKSDALDDAFARLLGGEG